MGPDPIDYIAESFPVRKADFYPVTALDGKQNYKQFFRIEPDGSIHATVHLDVVDASHREQLICWHYLRHLLQTFLQKEHVGVNITGRDSPWDFQLQLSTGREFFLEITSIADNEQHFKINKREERFTKWIGKEFIPLHELKKLATLFPDENLYRIIEKYNKRGQNASNLIKNPLRDARQQIFLSSMFQSKESLEQQLKSAIKKKVDKPHNGKEKTVLIVDNRTSIYDFPTYRSAAQNLEAMLASVPFPEIWFYTGYCSDDDGNNAEFSFAPLKVTSLQADMLRTLKVDQKGQHIW